MGKNCKLDSDNIKPLRSRPADRPLKLIQLCAVLVLKDSCILFKEHNVGDSSLSGKKFHVPIGPTSLVSPRSMTNKYTLRGQ